MSNVPQPLTDDSIKVRQLSQYQFTWVAGKPASPRPGPCSSCSTRAHGRRS